MEIDHQVHEVEEILESREDLGVQAVIHPAVKKEAVEGNREVDPEVVLEVNLEADQESRKGVLAEELEKDHLLVVLRHAPEVEADQEVDQGEGEENLIQEAKKNQTGDRERVDLEVQVVSARNRQIQIDRDHLRRKGIQSN